MKILLIALTVTLVAAGVYADPGAENLLDQAGDLLETGRPDSTAVLLYDVVEMLDDPDERVRALYYLATALERLGREDEGYEYLSEAVDLVTDGPFAERVLHRFSGMLLETGRHDECIEITQRFRDQSPESPLLPDILFIAGEASLRENRYPRAFNSFNEVSESGASDLLAAEADMKAGICLFHLDLTAGAIDRLERYLDTTPSGRLGGEALYYLGHAHERRGDTARAAEAFNRLLLRYPAYPGTLDLHFWLGEHYFKSGRMVEAENAFENFLYNADYATPICHEALLYRERIMFRTGRYASEADIARNFIEKYPDSPLTPGLMFDLARYYGGTGRTVEAVRQYQTLLETPAYAAHADSAMVLAAELYAGRGEREQAVAFLADIVQTAADSAQIQSAAVTLGDLNTRWGRYDEAISWYEHGLVVGYDERRSVDALRGIAEVYRAMSRWFEATRTIERLVRDYPSYDGLIAVYRTLADLHILQAQLDEATRALEAAIRLAEEPERTDLLLLLGELNEEIDEDRALTLYRQVYHDSRPEARQKATALLRYGDLSLRRGNRREALDAFTKVLSDAADSSSVARARDRITRMRDVYESDDSINMRESNQ
jgi:tetratricopeptide (TPR) repeat protein